MPIPEPVADRMSEAAFQAQVIRMAQRNNWLVYHTHDSRRSEPGFPDLVLCRPPRLIFMELKRRGRKPTEGQRQWLSELARCGYPMSIWCDPSDYAYVEQLLS